MVAGLLDTRDLVQELPGRVNRALDAIGQGDMDVRVRVVDESHLLAGLHQSANGWAPRCSPWWNPASPCWAIRSSPCSSSWPPRRIGLEAQLEGGPPLVEDPAAEERAALAASLRRTPARARDADAERQAQMQRELRQHLNALGTVEARAWLDERVPERASLPGAAGRLLVESTCAFRWPEIGA